MGILVIAEHDNNELSHTTLSTLSAGRLLESQVVILVLGYQCQLVADQAAKFCGVETVMLIDDRSYEHQLAENSAKVIAKIAKDFTHILAPASTFGKNLLPRVAGLLSLSQISDVVRIIDQETFIRPIYAGNALETVQSLDPIKLITVRSSCFEAAKQGTGKASIKKESIRFENNSTTFISKQENKSDRPLLTAAKIVISGGRGLQSAENFKLLTQLADQLGAAIGASRAAVDAGFIPNDYQVGQTGKIVAPDLYIAIGISGAIQHIAGMKESKVIVAINKDPDAPIFSVADYGLVGDFKQILPELSQALSQLGYGV